MHQAWELVLLGYVHAIDSPRVVQKIALSPVHETQLLGRDQAFTVPLSYHTLQR